MCRSRRAGRASGSRRTPRPRGHRRFHDPPGQPVLRVEFGPVRVEQPHQHPGFAVARIAGPVAAERFGPAGRGRPRRYVTDATPSSSRSSPASGVTTCSGNTSALPPPWMRTAVACGPITATDVSADASSGSSPPSLRSSTAPADTARRSRARPASGAVAVPRAGRSGPSAPTRRASRSSLRTLSSTASAGTRPASSAASSPAAQGPSGPGIARSWPERAASRRVRTPPQSETTRPSKPHSSLSGCSRSGDADMVTPSTLLYADMTAQTPAATASSNGARYTSCRVRSSIRTSMVSRSVSASLPTKCFAVAATPPDWMPRISAVPVRPVSSGSSEKHSKCRPPSGERCRLRVGARSTSTPLRLASEASSAPRSVSSRSSQEAASAVGEGRTSEVSRSSQVSPRTPAGPSERVSARSPAAGSAYVRQVLAPVSRRTFCAASSLSSSGSVSSSVMAAMLLRAPRSHGNRRALSRLSRPASPLAANRVNGGPGRACSGPGPGVGPCDAPGPRSGGNRGPRRQGPSAHDHVARQRQGGRRVGTLPGCRVAAGLRPPPTAPHPRHAAMAGTYRGLVITRCLHIS